MSNPIVQFDTGGKLFSTPIEYLYYFVSRSIYIGVMYILFLIYRYAVSIRSISSVCTRKRLNIILFGLIALSLLSLMTKKGSTVDVYFSMIPAYHIVIGGTPLVNVVSQYGLLYLLPWVILFSLFPMFPITYLVGTVITVVLLLIYFYFFIRLCTRLFNYEIVHIVTVVTAYFFSILIRYVGFADPFSLVSDPPFTPLRFGLFIFPFYFLICYVRSYNDRQLHKFFLLSSLCLFYSFEVGVGIFFGCIAIALLDSLRGNKNNVKRCISHIWYIFRCIFLIGVLLGLGLWVRSGELPHITWYTQFVMQFGTGFLSLPIGGHTGVFVPIVVSLVGFGIGMADLVGRKKITGLVILYLVIMIWVQLPYYMGRSIYPTLYNVSLPFILLSGVLVEWGLRSFVERTHTLNSRVLITLCGYTLIVGGFRGLWSLSHTAFYAPVILSEARIFVLNSFTRWDEKNSPSYIFLKNTLPNGCPLVLFDPHEYGLLPALRARPAFQYSILRGLVTNKQQVDSLIPQWKSQNICVFINHAFITSHDDLSYSLYQYIWNKLVVSASLIATDTGKKLSLYTIPTESFIAEFHQY